MRVIAGTARGRPLVAPRGVQTRPITDRVKETLFGQSATAVGRTSGVTGKLVVNAVLDAHPTTRLAWMPRRIDLVDYLAKELRDGDVCISMGCGDIASLPEEILARRTARRAP